MLLILDIFEDLVPCDVLRVSIGGLTVPSLGKIEFPRSSHYIMYYPETVWCNGDGIFYASSLYSLRNIWSICPELTQ